MSNCPKKRSQKPFLSIVIPAYNEEQRLFDTLEKINNYLSQQKYEYEIIVVDDGSTDETVSKVKKLSTTSEHVKLLINKITSASTRAGLPLRIR